MSCDPKSSRVEHRDFGSVLEVGSSDWLVKERGGTLQPLPGLSAHFVNDLLVDEVENRARIHEIDDNAIDCFAYDDVARKKRSYRRLGIDCPLGEWRVTCAKDHVGTHVGPNFYPKRL